MICSQTSPNNRTELAETWCDNKEIYQALKKVLLLLLLLHFALLFNKFESDDTPRNSNYSVTLSNNYFDYWEAFHRP